VSSLPQLSLLIFYFLAAISIWLGFVSLRGGVRFVRYVQAELGREFPQFTPFVSVFVPCRGMDEGLKDNITSIFEQDYPAFEIVFVADRRDDPALSVIEEARRSFTGESGPTMQVIIAGPATESGQKVHNLRSAISHADRQSEVFVFVDTDARPCAQWLRSLVAPLRDQTIGATTGYRWFVPVKGGLASHLRAVWNSSIASALGAAEKKNFCWGGSTGVRRETFQNCQVVDYWRGTVSDDFAMTRALHEANLPIKFVPQCLTPSFEDSSWRELLEFTNRQMKITRAYAAHLWQGVLFGSAIFVLVFFGGIALVVVRALLGLSFAAPVLILLVIFTMGAMKAHLRLRAVALAINDRRIRSLGTTLAHVFLWPAASLLYLCNGLAALVSRRITWRGIRYELKSASETVIIRGDSDKL
jgi:cellulose synthase/poly-beta-1,6-N-acetylglucosamine synthase-like glycosyltransferase